MHPNIRRGLLRLWAVICVPWILYWGYVYVDSKPKEKEYQRELEITNNEVHFDSNGNALNLDSVNLRVNALASERDLYKERVESAIIWGPSIPIGSLVLYGLGLWAWRGFVSPRSTIPSEKSKKMK